MPASRDLVAGAQPKRAAAYTRVSTGRQAREGLSLDEQVRRVEEYIARRGWEMVEVFVEAGASGRSSARPELQRLLGRLDELDVVVIPKIDRFGRNFRHSVELKGQLEDAGVGLVAMDLDMDFTTGVGTLIWANMSAVAQMASQAIGERISYVTEANAAKGKFPGSRFAPYGYRRRDGGPRRPRARGRNRAARLRADACRALSTPTRPRLPMRRPGPRCRPAHPARRRAP